MDPQGRILEVRVFKSHPQLSKVESTWLGPKEKTLKIYLRDGKMREITTAEIANLRSASSQQLLQMAGVETNVPSAADKGETRVKGRK